MLKSWVPRTVDLCMRHRLVVVCAALVLAVGSAVFVSRHFAVNTDINKLTSPDLAWRKHEAAYDAAFPHTVQTIVAVVQGPTPEMADVAAADLVHQLSGHSDLFRTVEELGGGAFFKRNGLLYLRLADVTRTSAQLADSAPFIRALSADPDFVGLSRALSLGLRGVQAERYSLDDMARVLNMAADSLESVLSGRPASFSWKVLLTPTASQPSELRHFVSIWPNLDYGALEPGQRATKAVRGAAQEARLGPTYQASLRLTGTVPIADGEFASLRTGAPLNGAATAAIVLLVLWLALRSWRIVLAVAITLGVGLVVTAALGLAMVGRLNPISIAFAVLFVGLGADFAIQYSVRYRAERHATKHLHAALLGAAERVGIPLTLAAAAAAAGFLSFLPTAYLGLAELGLIAGCGMAVAYVASLTLLPALLFLVVPPSEPRPLGYAALAPIDAFLQRHRIAVVAGTCLAVAIGSLLLPKLQFDFNPLHLRNPNEEAIATYLELSKNPSFSASVADVLAQSPQEAANIAARLSALPEVAQTRTIESFIPAQQNQKLAVIARTAQSLDPALAVPASTPPASDDDKVAALRRSAQELTQIAGNAAGAGADAARRLAGDLRRIADSEPTVRAAAESTLVRPLKIDFDELRQELHPNLVTQDDLPEDLQRDWIAADGTRRVEASPRGDPNDNEQLNRFARAVLAQAPSATGPAIETFEWADTVIGAFLRAGLWAFCAIALLLWIALRRLKDVILTLVPLLIAALVTLEICALIKFPLNYANIIALPVLLGVGVAFKIYYVMAWRGGQYDFLQSTLTRAVFFSAVMTATAFGSLWLSTSPGISSMGKLLMLSLACTLAAATLFQPALMGPPSRKAGPPQPPRRDSDTVEIERKASSVPARQRSGSQANAATGPSL